MPYDYPFHRILQLFDTDLLPVSSHYAFQCAFACILQYAFKAAAAFAAQSICDVTETSLLGISLSVPPAIVSNIRIGPSIQEKPDYISMVILGSDHQSGAARRVSRINIDSRIEHSFDSSPLAVARGIYQVLRTILRISSCNNRSLSRLI